MRKENSKMIIIITFIILTFILILQFITSQQEESISRFRNQPYYTLSSKGDIERRLGNYSSAYTLYQNSLSINSKNPYPYQWMSYMYNEQNLFLPAITELNNARIYQEYFEIEDYDIQNLNILESYIYFRNNNNIQAQEILLNKVLETESIQRLSERYNEFNFNNISDRKFLPIYGDTYIILLYLKLNYTINQYEKDKKFINETYKNQENIRKKNIEQLNKYRLNLLGDIEINSNIIKLINNNYKEELIAYLILYSGLDTSDIYLRKYENIFRNKEINDELYKSIINNPFLIHDFENY